MFGGLKVTQGNRVVTRFRTRKTASLWAYLAYYAHQTHPREVLIEQFWPESESLQSGRNRLSLALSSLRAQFEPPGVPEQSLIQADRWNIGLNAALITTDTARFTTALRAAERAATDTERRLFWEEAVSLYTGPLLPGMYDPWIVPEQEDLLAGYVAAAVSLARYHHTRGETERAAHYLRLALKANPDDEDALTLLKQIGTGSTSRPIVGVAPSPPRRRATDHPIAAAADDIKAPPSLPPRWTSFFGRGEELARLHSLLQANTPLITLTGSAGVGKTRLVQEAAEAESGRFSAVWFVPLAEVPDTARLPEALADAVGVRDTSGPDRLKSVADRLTTAAGALPSLLILDTFEHLLSSGGAEVLSRLRHLAPTTACLVTSRQRVGLPGEQVMPLAPLPLPDAEALRTHSDPAALLAAYPSIALFVDRAQKVQPGFRLTRRNADDVATVVSSLEGIPLALELAAARLQVLTPAQMRHGLRSRLEITKPATALETDSGSERQRSLRAAIDWSCRLLSPALQRFFARLSVFHGGWTAEAAEAILSDPLALDHTAQLCDASLAYSREDEGAMRFFLLETVREFAEESCSPQEREDLSLRHLDYFTRLAESATQHLSGPEQAYWLRCLSAERDNLNTALRFAVESAQTRTRTDAAETGLRLAGTLGRFWWLLGYAPEGRQWIERLLNMLPDESSDAERSLSRARARMEAGILARVQGDYEAAESLLQDSLTRFRRLGDTAGTARSLDNLGLVARRRGDFADSRACHEQALAAYRTLRDRPGEARALNNLGVLYMLLGDDPATARGYYEQSLRLERAHGTPIGIAIALDNLGATLRRLGEFDRARALYEESLAVRANAGTENAASAANTLHALGILAREQRDYEEARRRFQESLRIEQTAQDRSGILRSLEDLALLNALDGAPERAARLSGAASVLRESLGELLDPDQEREVERTHVLARASLGDGAFTMAWARGRALPLPEAIALALTRS
jgi:predicted ATPase/DNA-binding SARP family transcriptional activator/Flp pilus assembly protein TadD